MSLKDCRGQDISTRNRVALAHYERAVDLLHGFRLDPLAAIDEAIVEDPGFVMAHCARAGIFLMATDRAAEPELRRSIEAAEQHAAHANDRERAHMGAARAWLEGDFDLAVRRYGDILLEHPHDLLALQLAHAGDFYLGQSQLLRDRVARLLPDWNRDLPGYGYVLGMHAFGLEENADYGRAEQQGRAAVELCRSDVWAVHAVTHVMEMQGRVDEGIAWLSGREADWATDNLFAYHNWWHLALYRLDLSQPGEALKLYDQRIRPTRNPAALEMVDASALLWRLYLNGVDVAERAAKLAEDWTQVVGGYYAFNDVHALSAFVMAERWADAESVIAELRRVAAGQYSNARMSREVGLPLCEALLAFGRGRYARAAEILLPLRYVASGFGGSHAQRDLLFLSCVEAALRSRNTPLARALTSERTQLKPDSGGNRVLTVRAAALFAGVQQQAAA